MIATAFILGLASSLHCIGMCGPIALMLPLDRQNKGRKVLQLLSYHTGRLGSYALLGLMFGLLGRGLYLAGLQQKLSIFAGIAMILMVVVSEKSFARYNLSGPVMIALGRLRGTMARQLGRTSFGAMFLMGVLNGFLPCGMVYAALMGAIAMQNLTDGISFMVYFGLGTTGLLSIVPFIGNTFSPTIRNRMRRVVPIAVTCLGILFIVRGLGLNIPYVSPSAVSLFVGAVPDCR